MTTWLNTLTPEQEALLPKQRDKWVSLGLSTEPANREEAERGVREAYAAAGLPAPSFMIWVDSPYAGAFAQAIAPGIIESTLAALGRKDRVSGDQVGDQVRAQVGDQVGDQVRDQVWAQVGAQVWDQVRDQVGDQVRDQVWDRVRAQVGDQVWDRVRDQVGAQVWDRVRGQVGAQVRDQVWAQVGAQVGDQVWDRVRDQVWAQVWDQVRGQVGAQVRDQVRAQVWDQVWDRVGDQVWDQVRAQVGDQVGDQVRDQVGDQVRAQVKDWSRGLISDYYGLWYSSWFETMRALGVTGLDPWEGQERVAANAYWWWCFKGFAVLSERPKLISRDTQGRLHSSTGKAVEFPDGWGFHAWHGTRVPEWVITDPTPERIFAEGNTEVRRAAIERFGWDEFIHVSGMKPVGEPVPDPGNGDNTLALYDLSDELRDLYDEPARVLLCTNGSPERDGSYHRFGLICPAHHTDPVEAAAELYGWSADEYRALEVRR